MLFWFAEEHGRSSRARFRSCYSHQQSLWVCRISTHRETEAAKALCYRLKGHFEVRRALVLRLYLQCFGGCCAMAHYSLLPQLRGLVGSDGLLPVKVPCPVDLMIVSSHAAPSRNTWSSSQPGCNVPGEKIPHDPSMSRISSTRAALPSGSLSDRRMTAWRSLGLSAARLACTWPGNPS